MATQTGDTCTGTNVSEPPNVRSVGGNDLACVDDSATCMARPDRSDGHPDGSTYQLDTNLR